jgi:hypothetical protein
MPRPCPERGIRVDLSVPGWADGQGLILNLHNADLVIPSELMALIRQKYLVPGFSFLTVSWSMVMPPLLMPNTL